MVTDSSPVPRQLKIVTFDLPFVIFVKDNCSDRSLEEWSTAVSEGRTPPYSQYAPCPNKPGANVVGGSSQVFVPIGEFAPPYLVHTPKLSGQLRFIRRVNPHRDLVLFGEVPGDRTGRASFSSVECIFDSHAIGNPDAEMGSWAFAALDVVNHFIQHYRVIANRHYIYPVTPSIIQLFNIGTIANGGEPTWQVFATGSGAMLGFGGAIPDEQDRRLRDAVIHQEPPDMKLVLDQQVHSFLDLQEWRLAIVETAVLFEAFIASLLEAYLSQLGRTATEIRALLHKEDGRPHEIEHLAKAVIRRTTGFDFASTSQYQRWKEDVCRKRNDIVHGRRLDFSEAEARQAFQVALDAASLLKAKLFSGGPASSEKPSD